VSWVTARADLLATAFTLLFLERLGRGAEEGVTWQRRFTRHSLPGALWFLLGLASKETFTIAPALALLVRWFQGQRTGERQSHRWSLDVAVSGLALVVYLGFRHGAVISAAGQVPVADPLARLPLVAKMGVHLLLLLGLPGLHGPFYDTKPPQTWTPDALAGLLAVVALLALVLLGRRRWPALSLALGWLLLALAPGSQIMAPAGVLAGPRLVYLAAVGWVAAVAWLADTLWQEAPRLSRALALPLVAMVVGWCVTSLTWPPLWSSELALFRRFVRDVPDQYLSYHELGRALVEQGQIPEGLGFLWHAHQMAPQDPELWRHSILGHLKGASWLIRQQRSEEALALVRRAIALDPRDQAARDMLVYVCLQKGASQEAGGQRQQATETYGLALRLAPTGKGADLARRKRAALRH
jgi:hypothetical protein